MALAKALGGGFPIGACLATAEAGKGMAAGTHGSTFGGNPLAMAAGNAVLDVMLAPGFLEHVQQAWRCCSSRSSPAVSDRYPDVVAEVRGEGLLIGIKRSGAERRLRRMRCATRQLLTVGRRRQRRAHAAAADRQRERDRRGCRSGSSAPARSSKQRS